MKYRLPLHVQISTIFLALILLVGGIIGSLGYKISRDILESTASELNTRISRETLVEFSSLIGPSEMAVRLLSFDGVSLATSLQERMSNIGFMREALSNSEVLSSIYIGYGNGDFFMVRRLANEIDRAAFNAPEKTAYIVQSIEHTDESQRGVYIYLTLRWPHCAATNTLITPLPTTHARATGTRQRSTVTDRSRPRLTYFSPTRRSARPLPTDQIRPMPSSVPIFAWKP